MSRVRYDFDSVLSNAKTFSDGVMADEKIREMTRESIIQMVVSSCFEYRDNEEFRKRVDEYVENK
ncbi:hypothetical protein PC41400_14735 [Paenibacillus chitinolyticus]|uniref:Uncharacterized protein n=1 Tax=Paenibacillus chitinolyticus TaxID=79263 RepID=A0A410WWR8_9BACL|nr:hypothetical protein [Paenibacillus chitinolyticus]MCY9593971.1 hypothetical protein [Paenibacillus chitinolyticus]MCY9599626.1 hypothetical protein [Paenibacillus chitinolyticus]QAV18865.1 hypothetical protein PC41400_14735 [Paenibacillus chitinolyticus]